MKKQNVLLVPYVSQTDKQIDVDWHNRACGVVSLAMIMSYYDCDNINLMNLINEGVMIGGYTNHGWIHESLVRLCRNHGLHAYAEEFLAVKVDLINKKFQDSPFSRTLEQNGIEKITLEIDHKRPVLISVHPGFRNNIETHVVVVIGYEGNPTNPSGFYVHDPDNRFGGDGNEVFVERAQFDLYWRKFAIFIRPFHQI